MASVLKSVYSQHAFAAALGLFIASGVTPAGAADLGGNCCADLEERIAELEATTARKGNRKVSLTISGWVNEAVFLWDDGTERNAYVGTNSLEQSRVKLQGEAKIDGDWSAGYTLEVGVAGHPSNQWDQTGPGSTSTTPTSQDNALVVRKSNWWIKNKDVGKLTVGLEGSATYHLLDDADGANTRNYSDYEAAAVAQGRFFVRNSVGGLINSGGNLRWSDVLRGPNNASPGQDSRRNIVRYDSPTIMGFTLTASWGEDDQAAGALTYKGEIGDFNIVAKAGYEKNTDEGSSSCHGGAKNQDCEWWGIAGTIMHKPTGLYVYGGYAEDQDNTRGELVAAAQQALVQEDDRTWFIQAGIEQKWMSLGKTTLFGEYRNDQAGSNVNGATIRTQSADLDFWAAGIVQNVDAAAMDLYLIYRHADGDVLVGTNAASTKLDDFDMLITGARIQF